jgi:dienelactone hydrolase
MAGGIVIMTGKQKKLGAGACLIVLAAALPAGAATLPPGRLLERVPGRVSGQSYAIYLPTGYAVQKRWPVIVCFDPGGNGAVPVRLFREAAEARGWIVIGSNNSRNGPWEPNFEAARALWDELRFLAADERRIYTAGFSGGAQMALLMAARPEFRPAGVLACSNDLPDWIPAEKLRRDAVYFTATGRHDFNYWPVMRLNERLRECRLVSECETFPGPHAWPPADLLGHALEWFDVQAMRSGSLPHDEEIMSRVETRLQGGFRQLEQEGRLAEALEGWERLALSRAGASDLAEIQSHIEALRNSPQLDRSQKKRARQQKEEAEQLVRLKRKLAQLWAPEAEPLPHRQRIASLGIDDMLRTAEKKAGTPEGESAGRLLSQLLSLLLAQAQTVGYDSLNAGHCDEAILCFEIATSIQPGQPLLLYNLACAQARGGDRKNALQSLQRSVDAGFHDQQLMATDKDLKTLRSEPLFILLLERLRAANTGVDSASNPAAGEKIE